MHKLYWRVVLIVLFLVVPVQIFAQGKQNWTSGGEMDPLQARFTVKHYSLDIEVLPRIKGIDAAMEMLFETKGRLDTIRLDLIMNYKVLKVESEGQELDFRHQDDLLDIYLEKPTNRLKVFYRGKPPVAVNPPWQGGFTWESDSNGHHWVGLSCQNEGAKIFMPCLDHPSSEPANGVDLYFKVPFPYFVASNGRLLNQATSVGFNYFHWATAYPVNNYNINFTVGRLYEKSEAYTSVSGKRIPMTVFVLEENLNKAGQLLEVLENSVRTQEKYFGEFPFSDDKIAVVETPYLGMEHQTINAYGNKFHFQDIGGVRFDWLLHHELGHEWWGNKISVGDWADIWIHEGVCSYGDLLFYLDHGGQDAYLERAAEVARNVENSRPLVGEKNATMGEAYHPDIYTKGAIVLHSLRFMLGDEVFFPMLKSFAAKEEFSYNNRVSTDDFVNYVNEFAGKDLSPFFETYLYSTDIPKVKVNRKGRDRYDISLKGVGLSLPVEVLTTNGIEKILISNTPVRVKSDDMVVIDPNGWYLLDK